MSGQIIANASRILELDEGINNSLSKIDVAIDNNKNIIRDTKEKITEKLELYRERQRDAFDNLVIAREALLNAEEGANNTDDIEVPDFYYTELSECQSLYDEISRICALIERIDSDFCIECSEYETNIENDRQGYIDLIKKSSALLNQFAELVKKSSSVITDDFTGGKTFLGGVKEKNSPDSNEYRHSTANNIESFCPPELQRTNQIWETDKDGNIIFNTPIETGRKLDSCQGKVEGYLGTCGLVSCVNVLRLAGYQATESEVVRYASTSKDFLGRGLCTINSIPEDNGGTSAKSRQQVLYHFGIKSELVEASIRNISDAVSEGRGVIISVFAGILYTGSSDYNDLHAITVTSVKKDQYGNILGFYVCDSGTGGVDNATFYSSYEIEKALSGRKMNVTTIIR